MPHVQSVFTRIWVLRLNTSCIIKCAIGWFDLVFTNKTFEITHVFRKKNNACRRTNAMWSIRNDAGSPVLLKEVRKWFYLLD